MARFEFQLPISMKDEVKQIAKEMKKNESFIARKSLRMFINSKRGKV